MGFLDAIKALGKMEEELTQEGESVKKTNEKNDPLVEIANLLQLPLPLPKGKGTPPKVIRIWCKVSDLEKNLVNEDLPLDILGIEKIDMVEYSAGGDAPDPEDIKKKYLYHSPAGTNIKWQYSPLYKLGKAKKNANAQEELVGEGGSWNENTETRFFKLKKSVLQAYETCSVWTSGSVERIMKDLEEHVENLASLWKDANASTLLVFGAKSPSGEFLWPGEIPAYRRYFKEKVREKLASSPKKTREKLASSPTLRCSSCLSEIHASEPHFNLDKIFKFATLDKPSFLPGNQGKAVSGKIWPLCQNCCGLMSRGRGYIEEHYMRSGIFPGLHVFVIPELLFTDGDMSKHLPAVAEETKDFLRRGIKKEKKLFSFLANQKESLVFHFLFWEKNNSQERVHLMVEDIPPSRLKRLEEKWKGAVTAYPFTPKGELTKPQRDYVESLDYAFGAISNFFLWNAKDESQKKWLRDRALNIIGRLMGEEQVDIREAKRLAVSRLPAHFHNSDNRREKSRDKGDESGIREDPVISMARVVDFLVRTNER